MHNSEISKVDSLKNLTCTNLSQKQMPIRAGSFIMHIHRFCLNKINSFCENKSKKLFSIFSPQEVIKTASALLNRINLSPAGKSDVVSQISTVTNAGAESPMQTFSKSLSVSQKATVTKQEPIEGIAKKEIVSSQFTTEVIETIGQNQGLKTIRLKRPKNWEFHPGQYLEIRGENSINTPSIRPSILAIASGVNDDYIEITGMPNVNPTHSNFCLNCNKGEQLYITGPLGSSFPLELVTPNTPILLLGGGTGITPLQSIMRSLPENIDSKLIYSIKTPQHILYKDKIDTWKSEGHIISLTQGKADGYAAGRISEHLKNLEIDPNALIFICGPKDLVLDTTKKLIEMGVPRERIYGSLPYTAKDGGPVYRADHPKMNPVQGLLSSKRNEDECLFL